jgi:uncharacterized protein YhdP
MNAVDAALYVIIALFVGGLRHLVPIVCVFQGKLKPPSNLTEETLRRLVGATERATS